MVLVVFYRVARKSKIIAANEAIILEASCAKSKSFYLRFLADRIPVRRFQRWVTKVNSTVFGEILDSVEFLINVSRYRDELKTFLHEPAKCTCTTTGTKYKVLMDIVDLQAHNTKEAIGRWVARLDEGTGGRENGLLIMGRTPGTGKSTIACALAHVIDDQMIFQPCYTGSFPFHGWSNTKVCHV